MSLQLNSLKSGDLTKYDTNSPSDFCDTGYNDTGQSHCAHFVCHALNFNLRTPLCGDMKYATRGKGATMRVDDLFNYCTITGYFDDPTRVPDAVSSYNAFLVAVTRPENLTTTNSSILMGSGAKHVGIYLDGEVWNFSASKFCVVHDSLSTFSQKMKHHYGKNAKFLYAYRQDI